ncbi:FG-GAP repeat domain-containing protein [Bacteroidota bacterium]
MKHISTPNSLILPSLRIILLIISIFIFGCKNPQKKEIPTNSITPVKFDYIQVDTSGPENPWAKISGDLDNDGVNDIIIGGQKGPLVWYKYPDWTKYEIVKGGYNTVDGEAADIDSDGDLDIIMGGLFWYENPGNLAEMPDQSWNVHLIADHPTHDIEIADLNKDGRLDIISRNQSDFGYKAGNRIHLWINKGSDPWEGEILDCPHGEGIETADLDNDDDSDIIIGGIWFENILEENEISWIKHKFSEWHPSASVQVTDINADGRKDIILAPSELAGNFYKISWFESPYDFSDSNWKEHIIFDSLECVIHSLAIGDLNIDEMVDIVYAEMHQGEDPDEVVILLNQENGSSWDKIVLSEKGSHGIQVADINGDGLLDIFGANWSSEYQPVELWIGK